MANGWTLERRKKQSELIRSWQPWKQSTGARTEQGKDIASQNALKSGLHTSEMRKLKLALKQQQHNLRNIINDR